MKKINKLWLAFLCLAFLLPSVVLATETNQEVIEQLETEVDGELWVEKEISDYYLLDEETPPIAMPLASGVITKHYSVAWFDTNGQSNIGAAQHNISKMTMDGTPVYCIEPYVAIEWNGSTVGGYAGTVDFGNLSFSTALRIWQLGKLGYGYAGTSDRFVVATQIMIWEALDIYIQPLELDQVTAMDISAERAVIENAIATFGLKPSFNNTQIEFDYLDTITLVDNNDVLDRFNFTAPKGFELSIEGNNKLHLKNTSIHYDKSLSFETKDIGGMTANVMYGLPGSQMVFMASQFDPPYTINFKMKMITGDLEVTKLDEFGNLAEAGQKFGIWLSETETDADGNVVPTWYKGTQIQTSDGKDWFTAVNGKLEILDLLPPSYYIIEELAVTNPYEVAEFEARFEIKKNEKTEIEFFNKLRNVVINLNKIDAEEKWRPLNGATFVITDITNAGVITNPSADFYYLKTSANHNVKDLLNPDNLEGVEYLSSKSDIIEINQEGLVLGLKEGFSTVYIRKDDANIKTLNIEVLDGLDVDWKVEHKEIENDLPFPAVDPGVDMFRGVTGANHLQIVDRDQNNIPKKNIEVFIYDDMTALNEVAKFTTDDYGVINTDTLSVGEYFYMIKDGSMVMPQPFSIKPLDEIKGTLEIPNLKWGRKYAICEVALPEGYDFMNEEDKLQGKACQEMTLNVAEGINAVNTTLENKLRRLDVTVYKKSDTRNILLNGATFEIWDVFEEGEDLGELIDPEFPTPMIKERDYLGEYITGALFIKETEMIKIDPDLGDELSNLKEVPVEGSEYLISTTEDMSITQSFFTNKYGEIIEYLKDGIYYIQKEGSPEIEKRYISKGTIFMPELEYGHSYYICETKAPSGYYYDGNGCEVFIPKAEYGVNKIENYRINKMIKIPVMGD